MFARLSAVRRRGRRRFRSSAGPRVARAALLVGLALPAAGLALPGELEIHYINVQQGGSTLVVGPNGTTILMDAGNNGKGTNEIVPYLIAIGIPPAAGLDYTLASHLDGDHVGGFDDVINAGYDVWVKNWYNGSSKWNSTIADYVAAATTTTAGPPEALPVGHTIDLGGGALLTTVVCNGDVIAYGHVTGAENNENDLSVGVLIQHGDFDFLWAGDLGGGDDDYACTGRTTTQVNLETPIAETLTPGGAWTMLAEVGVDVLHVNHHGSASSTNSDWMNLLRPEIAVISVGFNSYGHPRATVVDNVLLAQAGCITAAPALVLQTEEGDDDNGVSTSGFSVGDVILVTDGVGYAVSATGEVTQGPDERAAAGLPFAVLADDWIFLDGFESGDLSLWSGTVP